MDVDILVQERVGKSITTFRGSQIQSGSGLAASCHEHTLLVVPTEYLASARSLSFMFVNRKAKTSY